MESTPDLVSARTLQRERTARKEAESLLEQKSRELYEKNQFLQESELRYRNLVELAPDAIWIHCEGRITFLNQAALRLFGATCPEQLLGTGRGPGAGAVPAAGRSLDPNGARQSAPAPAQRAAPAAAGRQAGGRGILRMLDPLQ
jgi:PAS domain-containing protein